MPQASEIQRPGASVADSEDAVKGIVIEASGVVTEEKLLTARDELEQDRKKNPSIVSIFALILRYHVPLIDLRAPRGGVAGGYGEEGGGDDDEYEWKEVHLLGAGTSCSVTRYETDSQIKDIYPPGTLVALKKYHSTRSETVGGKISKVAKKLHQLIWQELQVFCHPFLHHHENICRLLFVGWEDASPLPALGLEHATYGTLANALQNLRSYGSDLRKSHITVDIVLGLGALHACGFGHGDIKTSNILIQDHASRSIVAKISDFTGAGPLSTFGQASHSTFGTSIWEPPEVLFRDQDDSPVECQAADVYSLGMVIATIWCRQGFIPEGGTFLDPVMAYDLDQPTKDLVAGIWKHQCDDAPQSVMNIAKQMAGNRDWAPIPVLAILSHTLSSIPEQRLDTMGVIAGDLRPFMEQNERAIMFSEPLDKDLQVYDDDVSYTYGVVADERYQERTRAFKEMFLSTMVETATEVLETVRIPQYPDLEYPFRGDDEDLQHTLSTIDRYHLVQLRDAKIPAYFAIMANEIYTSYLGGCGTRVDELSGVTWLRHAAATGSGRAVHLFCALEQSVEQVQNTEAPRRLWAASAGLSGFQQSADYLRNVDPDLHTLVTMYYRRHYWGRASLQVKRIENDYYFDELEKAIRADSRLANEPLPSGRPPESATDVKETPLHFAAAVGNLDFVKFLIVEAGADVNATNLRNETPIFYATRAGQFEIAKLLLQNGAAVTHVSTEGVSIMHCLALMDDCDAVTLAPLYLSRGATVQLKASEELGDYFDALSCCGGLPIMWAAAKKRYQLFQVFLRAHEDHSMCVEDVKDLLELLSASHLGEMLETTLSVLDKIADPDFGAFTVPDDIGHDIQLGLTELSIGAPSASHVVRPDPLSALSSQDYLSALLLQASDTVFGSIKRRYLHGKMFRAAKTRTLATLLGRGADPLGTDIGDGSETGCSALCAAVYNGDHVSLKVFVEHLERNGVDVLLTLANCNNFGGYNALVRSIYVDGRENFLFLLDRYPSLTRSVGAGGRTPLHAAATQAWAGYASKLLDSGGVERCARADDGATPFIWAVMRNSNLEVADILAGGADMDAVLGPDPTSGFTAFAKVVCAMTYWRMDIDISRLRYLIDKFGPPSFYSNVPDQCTLFRTLLLLRPAFTDREQLDLVASILRLILETFPDKIDFIDSTGRTALHYAAWYGNKKAVEVLVEKKASLNIEATPPVDQEEESGIAGHTPLDLAVIARRTGPGGRVRESFRDIEEWEHTMDDIIGLLYREGGKSGSAASFATALWPDIRVGELSNVSVIDDYSLRDMTTDQAGDAKWPKPLPREMDPSHHAGGEGQETVEVLESNGLSTRRPAEVFRLTQLMVGAIDSSARVGNWTRRPPTPPEGFLDRARMEWLNIRQQRKSMSTATGR